MGGGESDVQELFSPIFARAFKKCMMQKFDTVVRVNTYSISNCY